MTRGGDGLSDKLNTALSKVREGLIDFLDDVNSGWYDMLTKEDFIMRVRMALDDLDGSELGWLFDEHVKGEEGEEVDEDEPDLAWLFDEYGPGAPVAEGGER